MADLIERDKAIRTLDAVCDRVCQYTKKQRSVMCGACPLGGAFDAIEELSPAQPEYKLDEWCTDCKEYDSEAHCCPRFNRVIRTVMGDAKPEQRWIPASERLPEEDEDVLVTVFFHGLTQKHTTGWNDHIKPKYYVDIASQIDGEWTSYSDEYKVAKSQHEVIAWCELPEPYKEGQDE